MDKFEELTSKIGIAHDSMVEDMVCGNFDCINEYFELYRKFEQEAEKLTLSYEEYEIMIRKLLAH